MPHYDPSTGELVVRIVYDGSGEAGKTTSIQGLCSLVSLQRRGPMQSPGAMGRRTEYFDWLDFSGGFIDGRRVRCQLVSVPGQIEFSRRRERLLHSADAVVFVLDSRPDALEESRERLVEARQTIAALPGPPVGMVLQANKRDVPEALPIPALTERLELDSNVAVVPTVAVNGDGLIHAFVLATRLATDRARAQLSEGLPALPEEAASPAALHAAMVALEHSAGSSGSAKGDPWLDEAPFQSARVRNPVPEGWKCSLHAGLDISAGHVWPPVKGRALLTRASVEPFAQPEFLAPWAPSEAFEVRSADDWAFHSLPGWSFASESEARACLLSVVRSQMRFVDLIPEGRALFLSSDGERSRIWLLSPPEVETLRQSFLRVVRERDGEALEVIRSCVRGLDTRLGDGHGMSLDDVCVTGKVSILALPQASSERRNSEGPPTANPEPRAGLYAQLGELERAAVARDPFIKHWLWPVYAMQANVRVNSISRREPF
ncbi:MAG TPA: hypothetical protein VFQ61_23110 [Polyangiaceae bacterium]|nr:hypothetical protein [Polyangiaceae bacterium]